MLRKAVVGSFLGVALLGQLRAQDVVIMREEHPVLPAAQPIADGSRIADAAQIEKAIPVPHVKPQAAKPAQSASSQPLVVFAHQTVPAPAPKVSSIAQSGAGQRELAMPAKIAAPKPAASALVAAQRSQAQIRSEVHQQEAVAMRSTSAAGATAFTRVADGFDFPVGPPDAQRYYKARGFQSPSHLGEDWDGTGGGNTDLNDPVYCIGDGVVVFARDCRQGWGNVVIVRHAYRHGGTVQNIDSLYAHCQKILVQRGQSVRRGQQIARIGTAHGLYDAHLHFEIRKNITIGMSRDKFAKNSSNYHNPTEFINAHRRLQGGGSNYRIAMNTFAHDERIRWDKLRTYSRARTGGSSGESARALKKAVASQNVSTR